MPKSRQESIQIEPSAEQLLPIRPHIHLRGGEGMRIVSGAIVLAGVVLVGGSLGAAEIPKQFTVWGSTAGEQGDLPAGWREVPPDRDDLQAPPGVPSTKEQEQGFLLFVRSPMDLSYPGSFPRAEDARGEIRAFTGLGEYTPLTFAVRALKALEDVSVSISDLKRAGADAVIAANQFDLRQVRCVRLVANNDRKEYVLQPTVLEKFDKLNIAANTTQSFWLTAYVSPETAPGDYQGAVTLRAKETDLAKVTVKLKVLPVKLKEPPQNISMSGNLPAKDEAMFLKLASDLWEHGMNVIPSTLTGEVAKRDFKYKTEAMPEELFVPVRKVAEQRAELWRKTEFAKRPRLSIGEPNLHYVTSNWDPKKNWFTPWDICETVDANALKIIGIMEEVRKQQQLPEVLYYLADEAAAHADTFASALHYYKLLKAKYPGLRTYTTIGGGLAMGIPEIERLAGVVDVLSTNRLSEQIIRDFRDKKIEMYIYNGGGGTRGLPATDRLYFGFYAWKSTATSVSQWAHCLANLRNKPFLTIDWIGYVYPAADGPVPSVHWEGVREGVADLRYAATLWDLIQAGKKQARAEVTKEAEAAEKALEDILSQIEIPKEGVANLCSNGEMLSPRICDKWRWTVAQRILNLHKLLGLGSGSGGATSFSPRKFVFSPAGGESAKSEIVGETELLADGDFENGLGKWQLAKWKGAGKSELDAQTAHNGKNSAKMTNTGLETVQVCVLYGGPPLRKGCTYRLSGWVKLQNVELKVCLRANLPGGSDGKALTGTSDWQCLKYDFTPTADGPAKYLCVWFQGGGTVWVDELSLREIKVPVSFGAALDSAEYYTGEQPRVHLRATGGDPATKPFTVTATLKKAATEISSVTQEVKAERCAVRFPLPAPLAEGAYEVVSQVKDATGKVLEEKKNTLRVVKDPLKGEHILSQPAP
jgi:hypothetical protein